METPNKARDIFLERDPPIGGQKARVEPGQSKSNADERGYSKDSGAKDDEQHDVVAADVGGAREKDRHDEDEGGGQHGGGVGQAGAEVDQPLAESEPMLMLDLRFVCVWF